MLMAASLGATAIFLHRGVAMAQEAPRVMLFGDSLLAGYGLAASEGFASQLRSRLAANGYDVSIDNASVSGDTSGDGVRRVNTAFSRYPDLALVGFGGNDMLQGLPPATLKQNLRAILTEFRDRGVPVLLLGMLASPRLGARYVRDFNEVYPDLAAEFGVTLYPFFLDGVALDPALNQDDRIHPNARGVSTIVDRILPSVLQLIDLD
jgi:acyl-CoA thioesterase-1